jgi:APA family basic amino acid/polyamine antiporter
MLPLGPSTPAPPASAPDPELERALGTWDGALLTIGAVVGTGIFLTSGDIARALPHPGLLLLVWLVGGLLTLAGALSYAELGALSPRAGGIYHFLKEAYGPLWGFLYGWAGFLVIMTGGIAALAVGFAEYLGSFWPLVATDRILLTLPLGRWAWTLSGGQVAAAGAILALTAVNVLGVREGAGLQNVLTVLKIGSVVAFAALGFLAPARAAEPLLAPLPLGGGGGALATAFGVAMIAALWTYDGWYGLTFSAGEMRRPERSLPLGLLWGTAAVVAMYLLLNLVYVRALPIADIAASSRIGEAAAAALFGPRGARLVAAAVLVSSFGCLAATILYAPRIYLAMARDGLFFRGVAVVDPRWRTPARSLWAQASWAVVLTLSGSYNQLYTYVVFAATLFHVATGAAVFVLRRRRPDLHRPYRVWGYPLVPALFLLASLALVVNTLVERPWESLIGLGLVALGLPAYAGWRRRAGAGVRSPS